MGSREAIVYPLVKLTTNIIIFMQRMQGSSKHPIRNAISFSKFRQRLSSNSPPPGSKIPNGIKLNKM